MFKRTIVLAVVGIFFLSTSGCKTFSGGGGDTATRILADINCVTTALAAGLAIAGDPMVGGSRTAISVLQAILAVGTSNVPATVLAACKDTLGFASEDVAGAVALVTASGGSSGAAVTPPPPPAPAAPGAARPALKQPQKPTPVVIPLKK